MTLDFLFDLFNLVDLINLLFESENFFFSIFNFVFNFFDLIFLLSYLGILKLKEN